jgi:PTS system cellobiose-specific IIA component
MEGLEMTCFEIISAVGSARSCYVEAIQAAKKGDFNKATNLMNEGKKLFQDGHKFHKVLIENESSGKKVEAGLLLIHSEDQMMSAEVLEIMAREIIELYRNK